MNMAFFEWVLRKSKQNGNRSSHSCLIPLPLEGLMFNRIQVYLRQALCAILEKLLCIEDEPSFLDTCTL